MLLNLFQQQGNYHKLPEGTGNTQSQQRATTTTLLSWATSRQQPYNTNLWWLSLSISMRGAPQRAQAGNKDMGRNLGQFHIFVKRPSTHHNLPLKLQLLEAGGWIVAGYGSCPLPAGSPGTPPPHTGMGSPKKACTMLSLVWGPRPTISYEKMHLLNAFGLKQSRQPRIWCCYSVIGWWDLRWVAQSILLPGTVQC